jgi:hypothetical protein
MRRHVFSYGAAVSLVVLSLSSPAYSGSDESGLRDKAERAEQEKVVQDTKDPATQAQERAQNQMIEDAHDQAKKSGRADPANSSEIATPHEQQPYSAPAK